MVEVGLANVTARPLTVAYHSACSMQHGQKLNEQPRKLLRDAGFIVKDVPEGHLCCGWAGTYQVLQPELSRRLRDRKVANIESMKPDVIASGNFGCVGNIAVGHRHSGGAYGRAARLGDRRAEAGGAAVNLSSRLPRRLAGADAGATQRNGSQTMLDTLFDKLRTATDPFAIQALEAGHLGAMDRGPRPAQRQLMMRGIAEMQQQELQSALATFTMLIETAPDLSEAWNKRATVHWLLGNFPASIADICETVKREPRHFGAYSGLGMIRAQMGEHARAVGRLRAGAEMEPAHRRHRRRDRAAEGMGGEAAGDDPLGDDPLGCGQAHRRDDSSPAASRFISGPPRLGIPMATLYVGGRLFDGEKVLDGQAVLEEGGKVRKVAPAGEFAGFSGEKVDTAGGTLIPGMIDCHVHSLSGAEGNPGVVQDRLSPPSSRCAAWSSCARRSKAASPRCATVAARTISSSRSATPTTRAASWDRQCAAPGA